VFKVIEKDSVQNLIIDIRGNPGGSDPTYEQPMMYLTDHSFKENTLAYIIFEKVPYEQYFWGISTSYKMGEKEIEEGKKMLKDYFPAMKKGRNIQNPKYNPVYHPKNPGFKGQLYLLIDEGVASAASHFASLVKAYARNATIVGVETVGGYYGHNGHMPFVYQLPNSKIKTKFSIVYVVQDAPYKPDQGEGRGIIPHYEVWQSFEDFMQNKDTQMEFVMKLINDSK
jgi:C-terminal processing protease CtpA/Prc